MKPSYKPYTEAATKSKGRATDRGFAESAESAWKILPTCHKHLIAVFLRLKPGKRGFAWHAV